MKLTVKKSAVTMLAAMGLSLGAAELANAGPVPPICTFGQTKQILANPLYYTLFELLLSNDNARVLQRDVDGILDIYVSQGLAAATAAYIPYHVTARTIAGCTVPTDFTSQVGCQFRIVQAIGDGTVILDTSRDTATTPSAELNTFPNFLAKTINENHDTRPEFMLAQIEECGLGVNTRFSTTILTDEVRVAKRGHHDRYQESTVVAFSVPPYLGGPTNPTPPSDNP